MHRQARETRDRDLKTFASLPSKTLQLGVAVLEDLRSSLFYPLRPPFSQENTRICVILAKETIDSTSGFSNLTERLWIARFDADQSKEIYCIRRNTGLQWRVEDSSPSFPKGECRASARRPTQSPRREWGAFRGLDFDSRLAPAGSSVLRRSDCSTARCDCSNRN